MAVAAGLPMEGWIAREFVLTHCPTAFQLVAIADTMRVSSRRVTHRTQITFYKGIAKCVGNEASGIREGANSESNIRNIEDLRL